MVRNRSCFAVCDRADADGQRDGGQRRVRRVRGSVIDPQRYPLLALAISQQAFDPDETNWPEGDLRFGLDRLLDGYEQFVRSFET